MASDLFHVDVPLSYIEDVFDVRRRAGWHQFQVLGPVGKLNLRGIDWVIVGGESGPGARPMDPGWVTGVRDQCRDAGVSFFFKQWGGVQKKKTGRTLEGRTWDEMPAPSELVTI